MFTSTIHAGRKIVFALALLGVGGLTAVPCAADKDIAYAVRETTDAGGELAVDEERQVMFVNVSGGDRMAGLNTQQGKPRQFLDVPPTPQGIAYSACQNGNMLAIIAPLDEWTD